MLAVWESGKRRGIVAGSGGVLLQGRRGRRIREAESRAFARMGQKVGRVSLTVTDIGLGEAH